MKKIISLFTSLCIVFAMSGVLTASAEDKPASALKLGEYIQMGTYYEQPILWRCVSFEKIKGYQSDGTPIIDSTDTVTEYRDGYLPLILADKIICCKAFDAKTNINSTAGSNSETGSHSRRKNPTTTSSNYWADSNIRSWLNSTASAGEVEWLCGNPPHQDDWNNVLWGGYENEAGFLTNFSENERNAIKTVSQKSIVAESDKDLEGVTGSALHQYEFSMSKIVQNYDEAYSEHVKDTMFLPDIKQIDTVYKNGAALGEDYFIPYPTEEAAAVARSYGVSTIAGVEQWDYLLRTPYCTDSNKSDTSIRKVCNMNNGYVGQGSTSFGSAGVRPAFFLDLSRAVFTSGDGTNSNPYIASSQDIARSHTHKLCNDNNCTDHEDINFETLPADFKGGELSEGNYYLTENIILDTPITAKNDAEVNLCLNGFKLEYSAGYESVINIADDNENVTINICDCSKDESGEVFNSNADEDYVKSAITVKNAADSNTLSIYGGRFIGNEASALHILMRSNANVNIYGGKFISAGTSNEYGVCAQNGKVSIHGGYFEGRLGIYADTNIVIDGGEFNGSDTDIVITSVTSYIYGSPQFDTLCLGINYYPYESPQIRLRLSSKDGQIPLNPTNDITVDFNSTDYTKNGTVVLNGITEETLSHIKLADDILAKLGYNPEDNTAFVISPVIEEQPSADNGYRVTVNDNDFVSGYQWYKAKPENKAKVNNREPAYSYKASRESWQIRMDYFLNLSISNIKAGQVVSFKCDKEFSGSSPSKGENDRYTYTVTEKDERRDMASISLIFDGSNGDTDFTIYDFKISDYFVHSDTEAGGSETTLNTTDLENGNYVCVATLTDGDTLISEAVEYPEPPKKETLPNLSIDYINGKLIGYDGGFGDYIITPDYEADVIPINSDWSIFDHAFGTTLTIIKRGNGTTTTDSDAQKLKIPKKPDAPEVTAVPESTLGMSDGKITGVSTDMEYTLSGSDNWTDCAGTEITELSAGVYLVRKKAGDNNFAGECAEVTLDVPVGRMCAKIVASYDSNGALTNITVSNVYISEISKPNNTDTQKVFYWESIESMKPIPDTDIK